MTGKEIGFKQIPLQKVARIGSGFAKLSNELLDNEETKANDLLVYTVIRLYMNKKTLESIVPYSEIKSKIGYSRNTIIKSVKKLEKIGAFKRELIPSNNKHSGNYITKVLYTFPEEIKGDCFEVVTKLFVESKRISVKAKEFIILIQPHLISSKINCYEYIAMSLREMSEKISMDRRAVSRAINELESLGYCVRMDNGFSIDLYSIQLNGANSILGDRNYLYAKVNTLEKANIELQKIIEEMTLKNK